MTLEASAPSPKSTAHAASDARGRKPHVQGGADASPAGGFMAALSAADEPSDAQSPLVGQDFVRNQPITRVDNAQAAIENIANSLLIAPLQQSVGMVDGTVTDAQSALTGDGGNGGGKTLRGVKGILATGAGWPASEADGQTKSGGLTDGADASGQSTGALQKSWLGHANDRALAASKMAAPDSQATGNAQEAMKAQDVQFLVNLDAMKAIQGGTEVVSTTVLTAVASVTSERPAGERMHTRERDTESVVAAQFTPLGVTSYASAAVQDAGGVPPDMQVAQQVTYWISQDIQNAELKLDGLGKNAVEVSISMNGNEAHVTFRTDELQARTLLEGATMHLKELLQSEGLVLSGVSVGTSGGGDAGGEDRKQRQGSRQSGIVPITVAAADARRIPMVGATGRTLDLFV
jgi:Flagellar hook-length control protein FliK